MFLTSSEQLLLVCAMFTHCLRYIKNRLFQPWKGEKKISSILSHFDVLAKLSMCVKFGILTTNLNTFSLNCCTNNVYRNNIIASFSLQN